MSLVKSAVESNLVENRCFNPDPALAKTASISSMAAYETLCKEAETDYEGFWARLARENLSWKKPFTQTLDESDAPFYKWFADGQLNASYNCLDRHLGTPTEHQKAIIFESDDGKVTGFKLAVKAEAGENVVFSWIVWPSKAVRDEGNAKVMKDPRMQQIKDMPFDGKRMIFGGFETLLGTQ